MTIERNWIKTDFISRGLAKYIVEFMIQLYRETIVELLILIYTYMKKMTRMYIKVCVGKEIASCPVEFWGGLMFSFLNYQYISIMFLIALGYH